eukprot:3386284-Rhodomonas_salina.3
MSGTDLLYGASIDSTIRLDSLSALCKVTFPTLSTYARATPCPVLVLPGAEQPTRALRNLQY